MVMKQEFLICGLLFVAFSSAEELYYGHVKTRACLGKSQNHLHYIASSPVSHTTWSTDATTDDFTDSTESNSDTYVTSVSYIPETTEPFKMPTSQPTISGSTSSFYWESSSQTGLITLSSSPSAGDQVTAKQEAGGFSLWQGVSIGLGSLCFIVLLAFIMTVVIICRLRGQLKRVRETLYPTAVESDHVYSELSNSASTTGKAKPSVKVELQTLKITEPQEELNIEEIHSPMSPDSQPVSSQFTPESPENDSSEPPPVKSRPPKRPASVPELSAAKAVTIHHSYTNVGFDNTENLELQTVSNIEIQPNYDEQDDTYEEYLNPSLSNLTHVSSYIGSPTVTVKETEKPAIKADKAKVLEERQNSLSGLPEAVIQRVNSQLGADGMPLQDFSKDLIQDIHSGIPMCDFTSGLPNESSLTLDDLDPYEQIDTYRINETGVTSNTIQQIPDSSICDDDGELYENTEMKDGIQSCNTKTLLNNATEISVRKNSNDFNDIFPVYDDGDVKMSTDNFDMDVELYDNHNTTLRSVANSLPPDHTDGKANEIETEYNNDNDLNFANFGNMPSNMKQPAVQVTPDTLEIPQAREQNGVPLFNSIELTTPGSLGGRFLGLDPQSVFKNDPLRIRSDSASTPENYYLDLEDPNPVLNVEETKRISTQFPSDYYIRDHFELHTPEKNVNSMHANPFHWDDRASANDRQSGDQSVALEFENSVYSNVNFTDPPDFFGTDSTT